MRQCILRNSIMLQFYTQEKQPYDTNFIPFPSFLRLNQLLILFSFYY